MLHGPALTMGGALSWGHTHPSRGKVSEYHERSQGVRGIATLLACIPNERIAPTPEEELKDEQTDRSVRPTVPMSSIRPTGSFGAYESDPVRQETPNLTSMRAPSPKKKSLQR